MGQLIAGARRGNTSPWPDTHSFWLCLPAWSVSACLLPSLTGTQSPSRPSTGSTATPSTGRLLVDFLEIYSSPLFQTLWVWSMGCGLKRVWVQHHGLQPQLPLRGLPLRRLSPRTLNFVLL